MSTVNSSYSVLKHVGYLEQWEDDYGAEVFSSFDTLSQVFAEYCEGPVAYLNVPVWVRYDALNENEDDAGPILAVGIMLTRKGRSVQYISPATPEQAQDIRVRMLRVWAGRADALFDRYLGSID